MAPKDIGALQRRLSGNGYSHPERGAIAVARRRQSKAFCLLPIPIDRTKTSAPPCNKNNLEHQPPNMILAPTWKAFFNSRATNAD